MNFGDEINEEIVGLKRERERERERERGGFGRDLEKLCTERVIFEWCLRRVMVMLLS